MSARVGWIVDVQNDFMLPEGRLYVHHLFDPSDAGAVQARERIEDAVAWMREHCDVLVYTGDWHGPGDAEIDPVSPDAARGTYPPHCMGLSDDPEERRGAEILDSIRPEDPVVLPRGATPEQAREVARTAVRERRPVFVRKERFSVFEGNPGAEALLEELKTLLGEPLEIVVVGVARDVCVTQAVDGMLARGYRTVAVRDATWGLGLEEEAATLERWGHGGRVVSLAELKG
ncbi:MAG TPA: isochorismatase family cysteine hydrolase [Longimicrobiaceae bacterium]|nr:isochorismatase family cysteine hydrolase [Longimicrobiaceae bacterium]